MKPSQGKPERKKDNAARHRTRSRRLKATYSLPAELLEKLDRVSGPERARSGIVAEALTLYFASREKQVLEAEFAAAARDPLFIEDNRSVLQDFAALDAEIERRQR